MTYADIPINKLYLVRDEIKQKGEIRVNLAGDRCIIKWEDEAHECIINIECTHRTHAEAKAYYKDPANGWQLAIEGID